MPRAVVAILIVAVVIVLSAAGFLAWFVVSNIGAFHTFGGTSPTYQGVSVNIPTQSNNETMAIMNLRSTGDPDAKFYAIGFARALADRLNCAPSAVTQQVTMAEIGEQFGALKMDARTAPDDDLAVKVGRKLAVAWVVAGDLALSGGKAKLRLRLLDTKSGKCKAEYVADGVLSDLPSKQATLVSQIAQGMGLKPTAAQNTELGKPNFSNPQTLRLYGQALLANTDAECEGLRWVAFNGDPTSSFAALRLLEYYNHAQVTIPQMRSNKRLQTLIDSADKQFPGSSHMRLMKGLLLADQCHWANAQSCLEKLVSDDPNYVRAHEVLAWVAQNREDGDLAVQERSEAARLWPTNPYLHADLASAYNLASDNARRGHYHSELSWARSRRWRECCNKQLEEAVTAIKMDRDCSDGWEQLLDVSLQLGRNQDRDTAYAEMLRINPKNLGAYETYAGCFIPQWGGSTADLEQICRQAEQAFGKNAPEVCRLRAWTLCHYPKGTLDFQTILNNINSAISKSKTPDPDLLHMKSVLLLEFDRLDEAQAIAQQGVERWDSTDWRMQLARCYAMRWDKGHTDRTALDKAAELYKEYEREIPFDTIGYLQYGWCLSHQGHREEAKAQFLKGLELDPANEVLKAKMQYVQ